jgi:hypothetical protein
LNTSQCDLFIKYYFKVNHTQRSLETPLKAWISSEKNGDIQLGHYNCMAGLSEVCSHVGALLFALDASVQYRKYTTCTQQKCKWLPSHVKEVPYLPVCEVDFSSAHKKYDKLCEDKTEETVPKVYKKSSVTAPSSDEIKQFFTGIAQCGSKSIILSIVHLTRIFYQRTPTYQILLLHYSMKSTWN